jgi:hypothetical protein
MPRLCQFVFAIALLFKLACATTAQEFVSPLLAPAGGADGAASEGETLPPPEALPSPLEGMGAGSSSVFANPAATTFNEAVASAGGVVAEEIPVPVEALNQMPLPDIAVSAAVPTLSSSEGTARLVRGDEVVVLSNSALRNSGVLNMALQNSATLAQSYHALQAETLRIQERAFEVRQAEAAARVYGERAATAANAAAEAVAEAAAGTDPVARERAASETVRAAAERRVASEMAGRAEALREASYDAFAAQARAEAQFEMDLWSYGVNGAKVGTVTRAGEPSAAVVGGEPARYVMVQAIGNAPQNNLGYSRTVVYHTGELGATTVPSEYLLPLPVEANDLFYNKSASNYVQRAPDGWMVPLTADAGINPVVQLLATPQGQIYHDTGFVFGGDGKETNFAENVSLESRRDPEAGQTYVTSFVEGNDGFTKFPLVDVAANAQAMDVGGGNSLQFFTVANNDLRNDVFAVQSVGGRLYNRNVGSFFEGWSLVVGRKQSIFGDLAATPAGLEANRSLLGTVNRPDGIAQFAVETPLSNYVSTRLAIEDPSPGRKQNDVSYPDLPAGTFTRLNRYPTLATSLDFHDRSKLNRLQLAGLLRSNGYEINATNQEFFATGWGLSAIAQFQRGNGVNFVGVAGGEGIGQYLEGIQYSVVSSPAISSIESIAAYGAYAGRSMWLYDECNRQVAVINAAYGYALQENPQTGDDDNRKLHQAWINYTRFFGDNLGVGVEYQYGYREAVSADVGEDHRVMMVVSLRTAETKASTRVDSNSYSANIPGPRRLPPGIAEPVLGTPEGIAEPVLGMAPGAATTARPAATAATSYVVQGSGATVDGRPIEEVVSQYQLGGAAFQQGL